MIALVAFSEKSYLLVGQACRAGVSGRRVGQALFRGNEKGRGGGAQLCARLVTRDSWLVVGMRG